MTPPIRTVTAHTEAKNDANKAATAVIRLFVAQYLKFAPVTNEDRAIMGLHNRDDSSTVIPVPETRAAITNIRAVVGYQVKSGSATSRRRTPARCLGFNGCLLNYAWHAEWNDNVLALKETALMTHSS